MMSQAGFFSFRWQPNSCEARVSEDIAVVFKIPGAVDLPVLPDLIESVCQGPVVPSSVVILQFSKDCLVEALNEPTVENALRRFNGRMPLLVLTLNPASFSLTLAFSIEASKSQQKAIVTQFKATTEWLHAGLHKIFDPRTIVVTAPTGYAFRKPSNERSTYFIRAELGLATSAAVSFVAIAILKRLVQDYGKIPVGLRLLLVDTMNVAATAFALRELLALVGVSPLPQVESFHSYGGLEEVTKPLPDTSLCIVSASSSMNLHRKWTQQKSLTDRDIVTLVTFEDAQDAEHALFRLPHSARPDVSPPSSAYDIRIAGEYFFPVMEPPRKVLLTTTHHGCPQYTKDFHLLHGRRIFSAFCTANASSKKRSLFIDADALLKMEEFQHWINLRVPQLIKAGTTQIVFQDDKASAKLAQHIGFIARTLGCPEVTIINANCVSSSTVDAQAPIVCVAAVVGGGNALLSLSRDLRNCHKGAKLYLVGMQASDSFGKIDIFDRNLKHSSHKSPVDVIRWKSYLSSDAVTESFKSELELYQTSNDFYYRTRSLQEGLKPTDIFLPSGLRLQDALVLNVDFAFWDGGYQPAAYQAEVLGTISTILQNARTVKLKEPGQQLRSPLLMHVALDPENFARFNEGIIQAALLRAALPSELDYRGDASTSAYMAEFLSRIASRFDTPQIATLEFLCAIATKRLQMNAEHTAVVRSTFENAVRDRTDPIAKTARFFLRAFPSARHTKRQAF